MNNPVITIKVNSDGTVNTAHTVIANTTPFENQTKKVVNLSDVDASDANFSLGSTLVYSEQTGKFHIRHLAPDDLFPFEGVDGGTF